MDRLIWTIGYGGRTAAVFLDDCRTYGITHILDVRSSPLSVWFPEFCAGLLSVWLPREGIEYVSIGTGFGGRVPDEAKADLEIYARRRSFKEALGQLEQLLLDNQVVPALMCVERHPQECHRAKIVAPLLEARGFAVRHILADGTDAAQSELPLPHVARNLF